MRRTPGSRSNRPEPLFIKASWNKRDREFPSYGHALSTTVDPVRRDHPVPVRGSVNSPRKVLNRRARHVARLHNEFHEPPVEYRRAKGGGGVGGTVVGATGG